MELSIIVYTMKGCPFCVDFKNMLDESNIEYFDRDIDENSEEYDLFSKVNNNEMIPAILIIEKEGEEVSAYQYVPERDYNELTEALAIIENHRSLLNE
jgi:glutaredoxin